MDALENDGPIVEAYTAEQDLGPYGIFIRGVPGAYFVETMDRDSIGTFSTLEDARNCLMFNFGEFVKEGPNL